MLFTDSKHLFNTDIVEALLREESLIEAERIYLNNFSKYMYQQYRTIRDCVNPKKCKRLAIATVRERLNEQSFFNLTRSITKLNQFQIDYILNYCERFFSEII